MRRSTFRTRVVTVFNKSRPCHKLLVNHLYIVSHSQSWFNRRISSNRTRTVSVCNNSRQDHTCSLTHTQTRTHHPHTHTLSFSRFVTHLNTNKHTYTHKHTHTNTHETEVVLTFSTQTQPHTHENLDRTTYTNTYYVSESQWWFVRNRPYSVWKEIILVSCYWLIVCT